MFPRMHDFRSEEGAIGINYTVKEDAVVLISCDDSTNPGRVASKPGGTVLCIGPGPLLTIFKKTSRCAKKVWSTGASADSDPEHWVGAGKRRV